jgi:hypothetical protein
MTATSSRRKRELTARQQSILRFLGLAYIGLAAAIEAITQEILAGEPHLAIKPTRRKA